MTGRQKPGLRHHQFALWPPLQPVPHSVRRVHVPRVLSAHLRDTGALSTPRLVLASKPQGQQTVTSGQPSPSSNFLPLFLALVSLCLPCIHPRSITHHIQSSVSIPFLFPLHPFLCAHLCGPSFSHSLHPFAKNLFPKSVRLNPTPCTHPSHPLSPSILFMYPVHLLNPLHPFILL